MIPDVANDLAKFERFLLDQLCPLQSFRGELFELHELGIGQNHSDAVIQIMQTFPHLGVIHRITNLTRRLQSQIHRFLHDL